MVRKRDAGDAGEEGADFVAHRPRGRGLVQNKRKPISIPHERSIESLRQGASEAAIESKKWCAGRDLNPHGISTTSPSNWRVCRSTTRASIAISTRSEGHLFVEGAKGSAGASEFGSAF